MVIPIYIYVMDLDDDAIKFVVLIPEALRTMPQSSYPTMHICIERRLELHNTA